MAVKKKEKNDFQQFKKDLQAGELHTLYLLYGEESYLREYYLNACKELLIGESPFAEFNLFEFEKEVPLELLRDAVEGYPAMAERKLVIIRDFDLFREADERIDFLRSLFENIPSYLCLIFYFDTVEFQPDKRKKLYTLIQKAGQFVECARLEERQLTDWIKRRFRALNKSIETDICQYMIFLCGNSMVNLITEIEKVAAFSRGNAISKSDIDAVCSPVMEAVIFDLTDALVEGHYEKAILLVSNLIAQKNTEVAIFITIFKQMQRLYQAKLHSEKQGSMQELLQLLGTGSTYFAQKITVAARKMSVSWLRNGLLLCARTDSELRDSNLSDKQKAIELTLLELAALQRN